MGPSNRDEDKLSVGDIIFLVILLVIVIFLIPFYSSIFEVLKLAFQIMVGIDTYIGLLGSIMGLFMLFLGFKHKNCFIKIVGLCLSFAFLLSPFYEYLGSRNYLKKTLGNYTFSGLTVVQPTSCELEQKVQDKIVNTINDQFGSELDIEGVEVTNPSSTGGSWKDKIKCMQVETHYVYKISYKDFYDESRTILYDGRENFDSMLRLQSYEIIQEKMANYLDDYKELGKVSHQFKFYGQGRGIRNLDRSSVISEKISFPTPNKITLNNFYQDNRLILEITFQNLKDKNKVYELVRNLEDTSKGTFPVIVHYGNTSEYYMRGIWYPFNEKDLVEKLIRGE